MKTSAPSWLKHAEQVLHAFGHWPSFHDGYLRHFERRGDEFECEIHGWCMTSKVDARGFFELERHHRVRLRFSGISEADLDGLDACERSFGMNILACVRFAEPDGAFPPGSFEVHFESVVDAAFSACLRAQHGEVIHVQACDSKGELPGPTPAAEPHERE